MHAARSRPDVESLPGAGHPGQRILICTDWWDQTINGVVTSVQTLRRELEGQGHEVRVLTLAEGVRARHSDGVYRMGSVSGAMFYAKLRIGHPVQDRIHRDVVAWRPDIVHAHSEFSTFPWAKRIAREVDAPLVHTYHTLYEDYTHYYSPSHAMGRRMAAAFSRHALAATDHVIAPTGKIARLLREYGVTTPIQVIPTGLCLDAFRPARNATELREVERLRHRYSIDPKRHVLVSVGRLAKEKNLDDVLSHLAALTRRDWTLLLVGDGPFRTTLEQQVQELRLDDHVIFTGCVDRRHVPSHYHLGDAFVSASTSETQGLTYAEAMACGIPLLCRRDEALRGVLEHGVTGFGFDNAAQFAAGIETLFDDDAARRRMGSAASAHALHTCGSRAFGLAVADVYHVARMSRTCPHAA